MTSSPRLSTVLDSAERSGMLNLHTQQIHEQMPGISSAALYQALHRQQQRGRIVRLSRGSNHWLIVPLQHANIGAPPLEVWLDRYMGRTLGIAYYVGLLSAAEIYGASPYGVMVTQVMVRDRRRPITVGRHQVVFHTRTQIEKMPSRWHETPEGRFKVGTPELTALELIERATQLGGMPRVREVLRNLLPACTSEGLTEALNALQEIPIAQRLGALLALEQHDLQRAVAQWLQGKTLRPIPLDYESSRDQSFTIDDTFKVRLNNEQMDANT